MTFQLYPAIDLKDGQAVRLVHGDMDQTTVFNDDLQRRRRSSSKQDASGCIWWTSMAPLPESP